VRRREFITLLGGTAAAWPLTALGKVARIAIVHPSHPVALLTGESPSPGIRALFTELHRLGYIEGKNLLIERYSYEGRAAHSPDLVRDVIASKPDLIIAVGDSVVLDFKQTTKTIPIVAILGNPVEAGIVPSLARPSGNITGVATHVGLEEQDKRIQLLHEVVPQLTRLGALLSKQARDQWPDAGRKATEEIGITWIGPALEHPIDDAEYRRVFAALVENHADAIVVGQEAVNITNRKLIVDLAQENRLPAIYPLKIFVEAGGLMSYGSDQSQHGRSAAYIADQILRGAKPSDIPFMQPTKFELAINPVVSPSIALSTIATGRGKLQVQPCPQCPASSFTRCRPKWRQRCRKRDPQYRSRPRTRLVEPCGRCIRVYGNCLRGAAGQICELQAARASATRLPLGRLTGSSDPRR
jgi:putative tryptophan/tyrosine transport system substrate-binding protein